METKHFEVLGTGSNFFRDPIWYTYVPLCWAMLGYAALCCVIRGQRVSGGGARLVAKEDLGGIRRAGKGHNDGHVTSAERGGTARGQVRPR